MFFTETPKLKDLSELSQLHTCVNWNDEDLYFISSRKEILFKLLKFYLKNKC